MSKTTSLLLLTLFVFCTPVHSDILLLDGIVKEPSNSNKGVPRPTLGMTAVKVKDQWGVPNAVTEPVGNPPIQRWEYKKFFVFFEGEHVIRTVFKKPDELKKNAKK